MLKTSCELTPTESEIIRVALRNLIADVIISDCSELWETLESFGLQGFDNGHELVEVIKEIVRKLEQL